MCKTVQVHVTGGANLTCFTYKLDIRDCPYQLGIRYRIVTHSDCDNDLIDTFNYQNLYRGTFRYLYRVYPVVH